jgi:hypothetical protein
VGASPAGFSFGRTGQGGVGKWVVRVDPTSPAGDHVLAQVEADSTDYRFPVAVADAPLLKDVRVVVRCKPVSGKVDRACGVVVRYRDAENYYVARANALEDNVNLYRVVRGRRQEIKGWSGAVSSNAWHSLGLEVRGSLLQSSGKGRASSTPRTRPWERLERSASGPRPIRSPTSMASSRPPSHSAGLPDSRHRPACGPDSCVVRFSGKLLGYSDRASSFSSSSRREIVVCCRRD